MWWILSTLALAQVPTGWELGTDDPDQYQVERSKDAKHGSVSVVLVGERGAEDYATLNQTINAAGYHGQRIRMTIWLRAEAVEDWGGAWLRVDGDTPGEALAFDNMQPRALRGNIPWAEHQLVLDVPKEATQLVYGLVLAGSGRLSGDDLKIDIVDDTVPVTNLLPRPLPPKPRNLNFEASEE